MASFYKSAGLCAVTEMTIAPDVILGMVK